MAKNRKNEKSAMRIIENRWIRVPIPGPRPTINDLCKEGVVCIFDYKNEEWLAALIEKYAEQQATSYLKDHISGLIIDLHESGRYRVHAKPYDSNFILLNVYGNASSCEFQLLVSINGKIPAGGLIHSTAKNDFDDEVAAKMIAIIYFGVAIFCGITKAEKRKNSITEVAPLYVFGKELIEW